MARVLTLFCLMITGGLVMVTQAQQGFRVSAFDTMTIELVRGNLYVVTASDPERRSGFSGGNTGVFIGQDGVTVVDTKLDGWGKTLLDRIRTITDLPIVRIINTHTHADHVGNNAFFGDAVEIVAHENTAANLARIGSLVDGEAGQPNRDYDDRLTLGSGVDRIELYYFGAGHTNGDTFVVYPTVRVLQTGDMFANKDAPIIDRRNGGSGVAFPETLALAIETLDNVDTVIPGHHPVVPWTDLEQHQRFAAELVQGVRSAINAGQELNQAIDWINPAARYPDYTSDRLVEAVNALYYELAP